MNTLVNFEIAKLLKEKGFKDKNVYHEVRLVSDNYYDNTGKLHHLSEAFNKTDYKLEDCFNAPTIAEVVMWLYEEHGIWIEVQHCGTFNEFGFKISKLNKKNVKKEPHYIHPFGKGFNSPTEAYEAAIEYTLNNLL